MGLGLGLEMYARVMEQWKPGDGIESDASFYARVFYVCGNDLTGTVKAVLAAAEQCGLRRLGMEDTWPKTTQSQGWSLYFVPIIPTTTP